QFLIRGQTPFDAKGSHLLRELLGNAWVYLQGCADVLLPFLCLVGQQEQTNLASQHDQEIDRRHVVGEESTIDAQGGWSVPSPDRVNQLEDGHLTAQVDHRLDVGARNWSVIRVGYQGIQHQVELAQIVNW